MVLGTKLRTVAGSCFIPAIHGILKYPPLYYPHPKMRPKHALRKPYLGLMLGWGWYRRVYLGGPRTWPVNEPQSSAPKCSWRGFPSRRATTASMVRMTSSSHHYHHYYSCSYESFYSHSWSYYLRGWWSFPVVEVHGEVQHARCAAKF